MVFIIGFDCEEGSRLENALFLLGSVVVATFDEKVLLVLIAGVSYSVQ